MSAQSKIEWTDRTWNPTRGCSVISPGCVNCYAMKQAHRFSGGPKVDGGLVVVREAGPYHGLTKQTKAGPQWTGVVRTVDDALREPLSWRKPSRVFVNSMSDLFHEDVPDAFIDKVFAVMALAERHTFQVLTKRPERMRRYLSDLFDAAPHDDRRTAIELALWDMHTDETTNAISRWPLPNVWLGVSVENQHFADARIPLLLQTPAAVRFISAEPLLGPVDLTRFPFKSLAAPGNTMHGADGIWFNALKGIPGAPPVPRLDWVIVGGESGPKARPMDLAWARSIVQQCQAAGVAVFVKQLGKMSGESRDINSYDGRPGFRRLWLRDKKGGNPDEWPADLQVREWPEVQR